MRVKIIFAVILLMALMLFVSCDNDEQQGQSNNSIKIIVEQEQFSLTGIQLVEDNKYMLIITDNVNQVDMPVYVEAGVLFNYLAEAYQ